MGATSLTAARARRHAEAVLADVAIGVSRRTKESARRSALSRGVVAHEEDVLATAPSTFLSGLAPR